MKRRNFLGFLFGGAVTAHQVAANPAMLAKLMPAAEPLTLAPMAVTDGFIASQIAQNATIMDLVTANKALLIHMRSRRKVVAFDGAA